MKKLALIVMSIFAFSFTSCSDDNDGVAAVQVPSEIKTAFEMQFPNATDVDYALIGNQYIIDFDFDMIDHEALYNSDGTLVKYKYDILTTEVPQGILTTITNNYENRLIDDAEILVIDGFIYYQIELDNVPLDDQIVFNADGTVNTSLVFWD